MTTANRTQRQQQRAREDRGSSSSTLYLSRNQFRACWLLFFLVHVVSIQISASTIVINRFLEDGVNGAILNYLAGSPAYFLKFVVLVNWILLAGHAFGLLKMLLFSLYYRRLLFSTPLTTSAQTLSSSFQNFRSSKTLVLACRGGFMQPFTHYFGRRGSFGIEGAHYDKVYSAIEVVSVSVRVFQAYKISTWIPRLWINRLFALLAILSCFSVSLIKLWVPAGLRLKKRVTLLVADAFFDFVTSILIPTAIAIPYVLAYNPESADFPLINYYHDTWFVQAVSENRQAFAVSWIDFLSKNYPKFSYLLAMALTKSCLSEDGRSRKKLTPATGPLLKQRSIATATVSPTIADITSAAVKSLERVSTLPEISAFVAANKTTWRHRFTSRDYWLRNSFFILSGLAVLVIHVHSTSTPWSTGDRDNSHACLLQMYPWFASAYHCAVVEMICGHHSLSDGLADDLDTLLAGMQSTAVRGLIFSSCPRLQMPLIIAQFNNLEVIKIYNCTIESWDGEASLTGAHHPHVQIVYIVNTNMSDVPRGLLSDDFPPMLTDIEFSGTNLAGLPSEVSTKWSQLYYFVLERSPGITEFPPPLAQLQISYLSLQSNNISHIPDDLLANQAFWMLGLSNNPLDQLPAAIGDVSKLFQIYMRATLVQDLPPWMVRQPGATGAPSSSTWFSSVADDGTEPSQAVSVEAGGSRLCTEVNELQLENDTLNPLFILNCTEDDSPGALFLYPLDEETKWRRHE